MMCHCFHQKTQMSQNPCFWQICVSLQPLQQPSAIYGHMTISVTEILSRCIGQKMAHQTKKVHIRHICGTWDGKWKLWWGYYTFIKNSKHKTEMCVKHRGKTQNTNTSKNNTPLSSGLLIILAIWMGGGKESHCTQTPGQNCFYRYYAWSRTKKSEIFQWLCFVLIRN